MNPVPFLQPPIDTLSQKVLQSKKVAVDVLRLDVIHPLISGNKWYKLKEYIKQAQKQNKKSIITFGGAFSNHIHATAAACKAFGLQAAGIIRGENPKTLSPTLSDAIKWGMDLYFVTREQYKEKTIPPIVSEKYQDAFVIGEGGYGIAGMLGAKEIIEIENLSSYTHIIAAVGTGTTLAGLIKRTLPGQQVIGISVLKNNFELEKDVEKLTGAGTPVINHDYHFGGYAKYTPDLIQFMNEWYKTTGIPSDFVYTGKLFYAVNQIIQQSFFPEGSKLLVIHSGGLQGNRSLKKGTLIF